MSYTPSHLVNTVHVTWESLGFTGVHPLQNKTKIVELCRAHNFSDECYDYMNMHIYSASMKSYLIKIVGMFLMSCFRIKAW